MSTKIEFLVQVAKARDKICNSGNRREHYAIDRKKAFTYRRIARELRLEGGETMSSLTDGSIDSTICLLNLLAEDESLFSDEQDKISDVAERIEKMSN